jgi:hypothetical protein
VYFGWVHPFLLTGARKTLTMDDLPGLERQHQSTYLADRLLVFWELEREKAAVRPQT